MQGGSIIASIRAGENYVFRNTYQPWNSSLLGGMPFYGASYSFGGASLPRGTHPINTIMLISSNSYDNASTCGGC